MARVNVNILRISELKWTWIGEFNSDDHYIYYCGQESLRRNGVTLIVNKSLKCLGTLVQSQKQQNDLSSFPRKPFNITVIQVYAPTSNAEEAEVERFYEDLQDLFEPKTDVLFIIGDRNVKVGSHKISGLPGNFGIGVQNEAGQRLMEFCQENALLKANTLYKQDKRRLHMDITRWSTQKSDWLYSLFLKIEKLYTVSKNKTKSWLWLRSWAPYCQIET